MSEESERLERLWAGEFGDAYVARNPPVHESRRPFWHGLLDRLSPASVLEVGCNVGGNLRVIAEKVPFENLAGVHVNPTALRRVKEALPGLRAERASAVKLPFDDGSFDLVVIVGVLIHQPEEALDSVMGELYRTSRRNILLVEYYWPEPVEVPYRGESGALFKRDYGGMMQLNFPDLALFDHGYLSVEDGWDSDDWWLFEKPAAGR